MDCVEMLLSRGDTHILPASEVGLPLTTSTGTCSEAAVGSFCSNPSSTTERKNGMDCCSQPLCLAESKVTFVTLGTFSPTSYQPHTPPHDCQASRKITYETPPSPTENCEPKASRFMALARKFNCFYFSGDLQNCRPFIVCGKQVGLMQPQVIEAALRHPDVFVTDGTGAIWLNPSLKTYDERSSVMNRVLSQWKEERLFVTLKGWRNECYEVRTGFADAPLLKLDRSAACLFGVRQYGVEINGYTKHPRLGFCLWLQRRALTKPTWPGRWDNMVAGGLSSGYSVMDTALKEAHEEASIPPHLLANLKSAGSVSFYFESERGLFPNTEFVYDLELPADFVPRNADGEVESFELVPIEQVMNRMLTAEYKTTSCPTTLDFLIRHGFVNPSNEPSLPELIEMLHIPLHCLYGQAGTRTFK